MGRSLVKEFITPEFQESVWDVLDKALNGVETANFEFPLYTKGGDPVDILLNAATRRGPDSSIIGVVGVGQNITELKTEKEQLSVIAQDLMRLIDYANAPIFGIDRTGKVNEWNRKAVAITGFSKEDVLGRNLVEDFITPEFQASVKEVLDNALQGKGIKWVESEMMGDPRGQPPPTPAWRERAVCQIELRRVRLAARGRRLLDPTPCVNGCDAMPMAKVSA